MFAVSSYVVVLALLGAAPGENTGWGTGEVAFYAYVDTNEHREIYPVCAGQHTVEVSIDEIIDDPTDVLIYVTSVEICYDGPLGLASGDFVEITGTFYGGACPIPYCGRVQAASVSKTTRSSDDDDDDDGDDDPDIIEPDIVTGSAEPAETTVTLRAVLASDGGAECRARFIYWKHDERRWTTEWQESLHTGSVLSEKIAGLAPGTIYFYTVEAENSDGWDTGRTGSFMTLPETVPPIPNPVMWIEGPDQVDTFSIDMIAEIGRDISGPEQYIFDFVSSPTGGAGGSDSAWQFEPFYVDVGLNPNHQYGYRVKARDGNGNETAYSTVRYAYSGVETPEGVTFGQITTASVQAKSSSSLSGLNRGLSGLKLENITAGQTSIWRQDNSFWTSDGLLPNTRYTFRAQARNGDADFTPFSPVAKIYTRAMVPTTNDFSLVTVNSMLTHWGANGNPAGTQFWCENAVSGASSGWITASQWLDTDLIPNVQYAYRVKSRNGDGVETDFCDTVQKFSAIEEPEGVVFGAITPASIQIRSESIPSGLDRAQSGLRFENMTAGRLSPWRQDNSFWNSDNLLPNRRYDFRAQARNGDAEQTSFSRTGSAYTHANIPSPAVFDGITASSIRVQWGPNGNPPGTLFFCENATAGTNSGWTILTAWEDTSLQPNRQYTYRVKAQNFAAVATAFSAETKKYSAVETPAGVDFGTITAGSIDVRSKNTPTGLTDGISGLRFENLTVSESSSWQQSNSFWTSAGLQPNTLYVFRAQARNGDGDETPYGLTDAAYTLANPPAPADFSYVTDVSIRVNWQANGNPFGTLYRCQNVTTGADSGWIVATSWDCVDLTPFTTYSFRVKARNAEGAETGWVELGRQTTGYRSLTISSTEGGRVSTPGEGVFDFTPGTTVDITAAANDGYHFTHWSGSAVDAGRVTNPDAAITTVLVDAHYTLEAHFIRTKIYVDSRAGGANDGSTWSNAFTSLQDALGIAQGGNEIRIAQGRYTPDTGRGLTRGDYTVSFAIPNGVTVAGGYAGAKAARPDDRDIVAYETILSGDLNGDDNPVTDVHDLYAELSRLDNSFHVVTAHGVDDTALLEGVTVSGGNSPDGAGIQLIRSDIVISQCTIRENRAGYLSGDGLDGWGQGAGISCFHGEPLILECKFEFNWSGALGGAVHALKSSPALRECIFEANHAGAAGGAICFEDSTGVVVEGTFLANRSWDGGAVHVQGDGDCRLVSCRFMGNAGLGSGGAVSAAAKNASVVNCLFSGNLAYLNGGAVAVTKGSGILTNCTFNRNLAEGEPGGGALAVAGAMAELDNCIVWDEPVEEAPLIVVQDADDNEAELVVSYSNIRGGENGILQQGTVLVRWSGRNIDKDPRFGDPEGADGVAGTADDDLRLRAGSPCVDAGNNRAVPADADDLDSDEDVSERIPLDLDGRNRFSDDPSTADTGVADAPAYRQVVDLGAYEFTP